MCIIYQVVIQSEKAMLATAAAAPASNGFYRHGALQAQQQYLLVGLHTGDHSCNMVGPSASPYMCPVLVTMVQNIAPVKI